MHVCHLLLREMPAIENWFAFEERFPWVAELLAAQAAADMPATWLAPAGREIRFEYHGIRVWLVASAAERPARRISRLIAALEQIAPAALHVQGIVNPAALAAVGRWAHRRSMPVIVQDQAGGVPRNPVRMLYFRRALAHVDAVLFGNRRNLERWVCRGLLPRKKAAVIFGLSSAFAFADEPQRRSRRLELGVTGTPAFGWVAHLDANKDPITVLCGLRDYFAAHPQARCHLVFQSGELLNACQALVDGDARLRGRVYFRGPLPHAQLAPFFQAIDYLVQGSREEAYGLTVLEAMAAGAIPIITDIPPFRLLTAEGRFGYLFPAGDARALARLIQDLPPRPAAASRRAVRQHFESNFSYPAMMAQFQQVYSGRFPPIPAAGASPAFQKSEA